MATVKWIVWRWPVGQIASPRQKIPQSIGNQWQTFRRPAPSNKLLIIGEGVKSMKIKHTGLRADFNCKVAGRKWGWWRGRWGVYDIPYI